MPRITIIILILLCLPSCRSAHQTSPPDNNQVWIGVLLERVPSSLGRQLNLPKSNGSFHGAYICNTVLDSPAANAGLSHGDIITHVAGKPVAGDLALFPDLFNPYRPGQKVKLTILRQAQIKHISVTLGRLDPDRPRHYHYAEFYRSPTTTQPADANKHEDMERIIKILQEMPPSRIRTYPLSEQERLDMLKQFQELEAPDIPTTQPCDQVQKQKLDEELEKQGKEIEDLINQLREGR